MIRFTAVESFQKKLDLLQQFINESQTLIVSDLETKMFLKRHFLREFDFLAEDQLLRVSELWRTIYQRLNPDVHIGAGPLATVLLEDYIEKQKLQLGTAQASPKSLYQFVTQVSPILAHPEGMTLLKEWWHEQPLTRVRSEEWFSAAQSIWRYFLDQNIVSHDWLPALLSFESDIETVWNQSLVLDLGSELLGPELELIRNLAKTLEVTIVLPESPALTGRVLKMYQALGFSDPIQTADLVYAGVETRRYTSQIGEIKAATSQVRQWLEDSVPADDIALLVPRLDDYWIPLREHLICEGIPFSVSSPQVVTSLPVVQRWCSRLRVLLGDVSTEDLLIGPFQDLRNLTFERFQRLFSQIYDVTDLNRDPGLMKLLSDKPLPERLLRNEFIFWCMARAPQAISEELFAQILTRFVQAAPARVKLPPSLWLSLFCETLARTEFVKDDEIVAGSISVSHFRASEGMLCRHLIVLGLSEEQLGGQIATPLMSSEVDRLAADLGFYLIYPQAQQLLFAAKRMLCGVDDSLDDSKGSDQQKTLLCFAENSIEGQVLSPSELWLRASLKCGADPLKVHRYDPCRFDLLQSLGVEGFSDLNRQTIEQELQLRSFENWKHVPDFNLSASRLRNYLDCPFIMTASTHFRLVDTQALDLDLDPAVQGQLLHKAVELAWGKNELSLEDSHDVLEQAREELKIDLGDGDFWTEQKTRLGRLLIRVLQTEKEWLQKNPNWRETLHEVDFKGWLTPDGQMRVEPSEGSRPLRGRIDRVDISSNRQVAIADYKLSTSSYRNWNKWMSSTDLQLALYMAAIEAGLASSVRGEVIGAFYFDLKSAERVRGMVVDDSIKEFGSVNRGLLASRDQKRELLDELQELLKGAVTRMAAGEFSPSPRDEKNCNDCHWSRLCRAPHLA